jgi:hypothetical protein
MLNLSLAVLKYLGMILTTSLGVLGLRTDFRDKTTGQVTRGGRVLLAGIVAAGVIMIATQALEDIRQNTEREDAIDQMARGQYPLRDVRLSWWADIGPPHPQLIPYRDRLASAAKAARAQIGLGAEHVAGFTAWGGVLGQPPNHVVINPSSPYYPNSEREQFASSVFSVTEIVLRFYRSPIPVTSYPLHGVARSREEAGRVVRPDLKMNFIAIRHAYIEYSFDSGLGLWASDVETEPRFWDSSGKIVSLVNLRGAQVFIELTPLPVEFGRVKVAPAVTPELRTMRLQVGELDGFWIKASDTKRHTGVDGSVFYEYRFPPTVDQILELTKNG